MNFTNPHEDDRSWQDQANCLGVDPDLFFPERGASTREAKEVCRGCVVRLECLEFALVNGEKFGIWGGLSERERRRLRRQRAQSTAPHRVRLTVTTRGVRVAGPGRRERRHPDRRSATKNRRTPLPLAPHPLIR